MGLLWHRLLASKTRLLSYLRRLDVVDFSGPDLPLGVDVDPDGLVEVVRTGHLDQVGPRGKTLDGERIVLLKQMLNQVKLELP